MIYFVFGVNRRKKKKLLKIHHRAEHYVCYVGVHTNSNFFFSKKSINTQLNSHIDIYPFPVNWCDLLNMSRRRTIIIHNAIES